MKVPISRQTGKLNILPQSKFEYLKWEQIICRLKQVFKNITFDDKGDRTSKQAAGLIETKLNN